MKPARAKRPAKGSPPSPAVATLPRKKKPAGGRGGAVSRVIAARRDEAIQKIADSLFPFCEPDWPGAPATWPDGIAIQELSEKVSLNLTRANSANKHGNEAGAHYLLSQTAIQIADILAGLAAAGSESAQAGLFDFSFHASTRLAAGFGADWPGALRRARRRAEIPGFISLDPKKCEFNRAELIRIKQGSEIHAAPRPGKKSPRDSRAPNSQLVSCLFDYMTCRRKGSYVVDERIRACASPFIQRILALEPFSKTTFKTWRDLAWEIIREWSPNKNPPEHPAFNRPPLDKINFPHPKTGKNQLWRKLDEAWRQLADCPPDIPPE